MSRAALRARVGQSVVRGSAVVTLNPDWDNTFLDQLAANDLDAIDEYTNDSIREQGGQSGQEIRNWIAAYAALSTVGEYDITYRYYRAIPEFIAGFSVTTALPRTTD